MESCDIKGNSCKEESSSSEACSHKKCPCGGVCGGDPAVCAMKIWEMSFMTALKSVQVDILKARIQKKMGPMLEKAADAVMADMDVKWRSMLAGKMAEEELKAKFREFWREMK